MIILTKEIAKSFDEISGIEGATYWINENGSYETTHEHLENVCAELNLDYNVLQESFTKEYYTQIENGALAQWKVFIEELMAEEPMYQIMNDRAEVHWGTAYYLNFLVSASTNGVADNNPKAVKRAWERLVAYSKSQFGTMLTPENIARWNQRCDKYLVPKWMKF